MDKPTVFFSHSSVDKDYISALQNGVSKRTSGTINIFQSSDGESIPFGNNWIHKTEENLHKAKLMFVFVSPESLSSSWIYFETGFAYAKNVKVIPIGIKGVDIGSLRPPLNLLQGFNLVSEESLNNFISILNKEFKYDFPMSFSKEDFDSLLELDFDILFESNKYFEQIDYLEFDFPPFFGGDDQKNLIREDFIDFFGMKLKTDGIDSSFNGKNELYAHGLMAYKDIRKSSRSVFVIKVDPYMIKKYEDTISNVFKDMYEENPKKCWFSVVFKNSISLETTDFKASSKLSKVEIKISEISGRYFDFSGMVFTLTSRDDSYIYSGAAPLENLRIVYNMNEFNVDNFVSLLKILNKTKVIS
ncbi:toll/interleukin-1 receptor domain-containing protein [Marinomonas lutimaris]|uniref:toll/interleukin-1 receptor domain-containing protein n=1 Tax=Marinomonas lutimaris TaxID=2846746 RepID=UPI001C66525F|nr:toll/interleukin-1 receptor domain-containing protein [Marinomonas lutimaris]